MKVESLLIVLLILEVRSTTALNRNDSCTTPSNEKAKCISIQDCKVILDIFSSSSQDMEAIEFAQKSQCGFDTEPLVCCGTAGFKKKQDYHLFFTTAPSTETKAADNKGSDKQAAEPLLDFSTKALPDRTLCGLEREQNRVIGGEVTEIDEFPWTVALEYKNKLDGTNAGILCGGSLINQRYVLTAAHCIQHVEFELIRAWLGDWNIKTDEDCNDLTVRECADPPEKLTLKEMIPHPFYSSRSGNNDIGLLRLERDIEYTDYIRPVCLPPSNLPVPDFGTKMTVTGWGITENGTSSDVKLKVALPLVENDKCATSNGAITANQLCAGGDKGRDACRGDSGGPLMRAYEDSYTKQSQWYQEGVVSIGTGCGRAGYPAIYTRVSRYITWIINNIKDE